MQTSIARFRAFNRFYTPIIGILNRHYLDSPFSLTEVRILFELHNAPKGMSASDLINLLHVDKGYLSRMLLAFEKQQLISKTPSTTDGRSMLLNLTKTGNSVFRGLDKASEQQASQILRGLSVAETNTLIGHMEGIQTILAKIKLTPDE